MMEYNIPIGGYFDPLEYGGQDSSGHTFFYSHYSPCDVASGTKKTHLPDR